MNDLLQRFEALTEDEKTQELQRLYTGTIAVMIIADPKVGIRLIHNIEQTELVPQIMNAAYEQSIREKIAKEGKNENQQSENDQGTL